MTDNAQTSAVFDAHAGSYDDALCRRLIPPFDDFYGAAVEAVACRIDPRRRAGALSAGASSDEWDASVERMRVDRCATVSDQLGWLREAGFADPDAPFRAYRFAVLVARRAG